MASDPRFIYYGDVPEPLVSRAVADILPHSMFVFTRSCPAPAWADAAYSGRCAYIRCTQDAALPTFVQDLMLKHS